MKVIDVDKMADVRSLSGQYYRKSEADKVIRRQKYKRCMAMAEWCKLKVIERLAERFPTHVEFYDKWHERWLKLAEHFKEDK